MGRTGRYPSFTRCKHGDAIASRGLRGFGRPDSNLKGTPDGGRAPVKSRSSQGIDEGRLVLRRALNLVTFPNDRHRGRVAVRLHLDDQPAHAGEVVDLIQCAVQQQGEVPHLAQIRFGRGASRRPDSSQDGRGDHMAPPRVGWNAQSCFGPHHRPDDTIGSQTRAQTSDAASNPSLRPTRVGNHQPGG